MITETSPLAMRKPGGLRILLLSLSKDGDFKIDNQDDSGDWCALQIIAYKFETGGVDKKGRPNRKLCIGMQRAPKLGGLPLWWGKFHDDACRLFMSKNGDMIKQRMREIYISNPGLGILDL